MTSNPQTQQALAYASHAAVAEAFLIGLLPAPQETHHHLHKVCGDHLLLLAQKLREPITWQGPDEWRIPTIRANIDKSLFDGLADSTITYMFYGLHKDVDDPRFAAHNEALNLAVLQGRG